MATTSALAVVEGSVRLDGDPPRTRRHAARKQRDEFIVLMERFEVYGFCGPPLHSRIVIPI
jgi:hypothetical protein